MLRLMLRPCAVSFICRMISALRGFADSPSPGTVQLLAHLRLGIRHSSHDNSDGKHGDTEDFHVCVSSSPDVSN